MFTGIITELGKVNNRIGHTLSVNAPLSAKELKQGDSICINGVCLTMTEKDSQKFKADLLSETLNKTNLGRLKTGDLVNLELALKVGDRLGGHIVTGHVDTTGKLIRKYKKGTDTVFETEIPILLAKRLITKGSIAINGVSLTVVNIVRNRFTVHLIPYTLKTTNLSQCKIGSLLNIELDKYLRRLR